MSAVGYVVRRRIARRLVPLVAAGVLVGLVLGLCLASLAVARRTASSYDRVLAAADAEDATVAHNVSPEEAAAVLDELPGIRAHRYQRGFIGTVDGIEPALTGGLLAPVGDDPVLEVAALDAGRYPDPGRTDEVLVNRYLAEQADLAVGQELVVRLRRLDGTTVTSGESVPVTVVGIGLLPREAVADETVLIGILQFSAAFAAEHEAAQFYANSRLWLDDPDRVADLARDLSAAGFQVSELRAQDRRSVQDALGPTVTALAALGLLAGLVAAVAAAQVVRRDQLRWQADDEILGALGLERRATTSLQLVPALLLGAVAAVVAIVIQLLASPIAPVGPLHDLDPAQGFHLDVTVALAGVVGALLIVTVPVLVAPAAARWSGARRTPSVGPRPVSAASATGLAGMALAVRGAGPSRGRAWVGPAAGALVLGAVATLVVSSTSLIGSPDRYGVEWDLLAFTPFGDQEADGIERAFGGDAVTAAASYTTVPLLVDGRPVPGLALTPVSGSLGPTILRGEALGDDDEIVLGAETAEVLDVGIGDRVSVRAAGTEGESTTEPIPLEVVGLATFAAISQQGTDEPRLGVGALVGHDTLDRLTGAADLRPEWTVARLAEGVPPNRVIEANPDGIDEPAGLPTRWYTDARPAELRQLDAIRSVLVASVAVAWLLLVALAVHAVWTRVRADRHDLGVLATLGFTRGQVARTAVWQAVPVAAAALVVGLPLGVVAGRWAFTLFARSIDVVDTPSSSAALVAGLVGATVLAATLAGATAVATARQVVPARAAGRAAERR